MCCNEGTTTCERGGTLSSCDAAAAAFVRVFLFSFSPTGTKSTRDESPKVNRNGAKTGFQDRSAGNESISNSKKAKIDLEIQESNELTIFVWEKKQFSEKNEALWLQIFKPDLPTNKVMIRAGKLTEMIQRPWILICSRNNPWKCRLSYLNSRMKLSEIPETTSFFAEEEESDSVASYSEINMPLQHVFKLASPISG